MSIGILLYLDLFGVIYILAYYWSRQDRALLRRRSTWKGRGLRVKDFALLRPWKTLHGDFLSVREYQTQGARPYKPLGRGGALKWHRQVMNPSCICGPDSGRWLPGGLQYQNILHTRNGVFIV